MAKGWYVVQTYSGHEQKIEKMILKLREVDSAFAKVCLDVKVPMSERTETKDGKTRVIRNKVLPGYILIEMDLPEYTWKMAYGQIKRIQGVSGFISSFEGTKPKPLTEDEYRNILEQTGELQQEKTYKPKQDFEIGEFVKIISGPFSDFTGSIDEIYADKSKIKINVQIFGRQTPVEVEFTEVEKI